MEMFLKHFTSLNKKKKKKNTVKTEQTIYHNYNIHSNTRRDKSKSVIMVRKLTYKSTFSSLYENGLITVKLKKVVIFTKCIG